MDDIINKLASHPLSPAMQDVMQRVRQVGLHKIAAAQYGYDDFTLAHAVLELGTKLAYQHLKQQKIATGMRALQSLEADNTVKLSNVFRLKDMKSMMPKAEQAAPALRPGAMFGSGQQATVGGNLSRTVPVDVGAGKRTLQKKPQTLQQHTGNAPPIPLARREHVGIPEVPRG